MFCNRSIPQSVLPDMRTITYQGSRDESCTGQWGAVDRLTVGPSQFPDTLFYLSNVAGYRFHHLSGADWERPQMGQDGAGTYPSCQRRSRSAACISATTLSRLFFSVLTTTLPRLPVVQSERAASAAALEPCCKEVPGARALRHDARSRAYTQSPRLRPRISTAPVPTREASRTRSGRTSIMIGALTNAK